jgi:hypothetical protein
MTMRAPASMASASIWGGVDALQRAGGSSDLRL